MFMKNLEYEELLVPAAPGQGMESHFENDSLIQSSIFLLPYANA